MPYTIYKITHENKYQVVNRKTGEIHAHKTTYKNAVKQIRLMGMMDCKKKKIVYSIVVLLLIYFLHLNHQLLIFAV